MGERFGRYLILGELEHDYTSTVLRAFDTDLERILVLKVRRLGHGADPHEMATRFLREARAVARLSHPNIVPVYEVGEVQGLAYFSMKFIDGISFRDAIMSRRELLAHASQTETASLPVSLRTGIRVLRDVAAALHYAHEHPPRVVHRDVKPGNILLDRDGNTYLIGFGIARELELEPHTPGTKSRALFGSPLYMSPEHVGAALGSHVDVCPSSDVFSLGVVLYEFLTTRRAFEGNRLEDILNQIVHSVPKRPTEVLAALMDRLALGRYRSEYVIPIELERICLKALEKSLDLRYHTAADMANDLQQVEPSVSAPHSHGQNTPTTEAGAGDLAAQQPIQPTARREPLADRVALVVASSGKNRGRALEELISGLFASVDGLHILRRNVRLRAEELDLVLQNDRNTGFWRMAGSPVIVECKNWSAKVGASEISVLVEKLQAVSPDAKAAILVALNGITGDRYHDAMLKIREARQRGRYVLLLEQNDLEAVARGIPLTEVIDRRYEELLLF